MANTNPYWLLREPGKTVGFGTVSFDEASTSEAAIAVFKEREAKMLALLPEFDMEAVLVTLTYKDGQPVVTEVK